jgi:anti-anti-sigma factor
MTDRRLGPSERRAVVNHRNGFVISENGPGMFVLEGELDLANRPLFEAAITDAVLSGGPLVLDMSKVTYMDSIALGALIAAVERLPSGHLVLHGVHGPTERLMKITDVGRMPRLHIIPCEKSLEGEVGSMSTL